MDTVGIAAKNWLSRIMAGQVSEELGR